ncbi:MAG: ParB/RepB/Spo0J family partition protein [Patescibacteria group bacterium]|nr:ParB/RepB/Spo0J family partition protein [Patescibacteria group bacterium]
MNKLQGLGRGLNALIPERADKAVSTRPIMGKKEVVDIPLEEISANPRQPRSKMDRHDLEDLVNSIKAHGIIQPVLVSPSKNGYQLIAGERRYQASKMLGLKTIPALIRTLRDNEKLEIALIENLQRENLNPLDRARAFQQLIDEFGLTQEEVSRKVGQSRSQITNTLRLLNLPQEVKEAIIGNTISEGHAKALLSLSSAEEQLKYLKRIIVHGLTVRQTEGQIRSVSVKAHRRKIGPEPEIRNLEEKLAGKLGTKVKITKQGSGGKIVIEYYSEEELRSLTKRLINNE